MPQNTLDYHNLLLGSHILHVPLGPQVSIFGIIFNIIYQYEELWK